MYNIRRAANLWKNWERLDLGTGRRIIRGVSEALDPLEPTKTQLLTIFPYREVQDLVILDVLFSDQYTVRRL